MKVLLDTSVLVAAMVEAHPAHETSLPWLSEFSRKALAFRRVHRAPDGDDQKVGPYSASV
ncbi:MAG: hypothetical protein Q7J31_11375 [Syntrophales bacterium]|nr:hypothetical protein [Syntrophales bacterium]